MGLSTTKPSLLHSKLQELPEWRRILQNLYLGQGFHVPHRRNPDLEALHRALAIDEASYGPEHSKVARRLNSLAGFLQKTNRLAEAEPLTAAPSPLTKSPLVPTIPTSP